MDKYKLAQGNCLELMKKIPDKSVDAIICDLPYGTTACKWDNTIPFEPLWEQYNRIIKDNGAIVLFGSEPFSSKLRLSNLEMYRYDWIWEKEQGINQYLKQQPLRKTENISVFYKQSPFFSPPKTIAWRREVKIYRDSKNELIGIEGKNKVCYDNGGEKRATNVLRFNREHWRESKRLHPTQKPVALLEYLVRTYTKENEIVLDNCMGSGTTGVACMNANRKFIGIELEEEYFNIAKTRIEEAYQKWT